MKIGKNINLLGVLLGIFIALTMIFGGYILYDKVLSKEKDTNRTNLDNQEKYEINNKDEINWYGINVKVDNGNIIFNANNYKKVYSSLTAKYIYITSIMATDNAYLFYITNNNELYLLKLPAFQAKGSGEGWFFNRDVTTLKSLKIKDNVSGFLDKNSVENQELYTISVMLTDNTIYNFNYSNY